MTNSPLRLLAAISVLVLVCASFAALVAAHEDTDVPIDIAYDEFRLDNGLRVIVHTDRSSPTVYMSTWFHVGSKDEPEGRTGFAHLFEHLMFQGSENHNDEWDKAIDEIGATGRNGQTNVDWTRYLQTVPTGSLERLLWLESDRLAHLIITQEKLDEQRVVVQNEKRQRANAPFGARNEHILRGVFPPGHPYRHLPIGSMKDLNVATLEDVKAWFKQYYGASNVVVALVGDIDVETAKPLMEKYYGDAPVGDPVSRITEWVPKLAENRRETILDHASAGSIHRVWPVPSDLRESVGLSLWGDAFASGRASPLYQTLVEESQLASAVGTGFLLDSEIASAFYIAANLLPGADADEARRVLDETLAGFLATGPDPDRLESLYTEGLIGTVRSFEKLSNKAEALLEGAVFHNDPLYFKKELAEAQAATSRGLSELANKWLTRPYYEVTSLPFGRLASATEGADRSSMPALTEPPGLQFPAVEERTLDSGIRLVLVRRQALPITDLKIRFNFGKMDDEAAGNYGVTQTAFKKLTSGAGTRDAEAIEGELERLGSYVNVSVGAVSSTVSTGGLTANLPDTLALVAALLSNPTYPEEQLELTRKQYITAIKASRADPATVSVALLGEKIYGAGHVYGRRLTEADVPAITRDAVAAYHRERVLGAPFTVFAVGNPSMDELAKMVETAFADWPRRAPTGEAATPSMVTLPDGPRVFLVDIPGAESSVIKAAHVAAPTPIEPDVARSIANDVIGGGSSITNRLGANLREDKGWSYGAGSQLTVDKYQSIFGLATSVQADRTADAIVELQRELTEYLEQRPATEEEFNRQRSSRSRGLGGQYQTGRSVLRSLVSSEYFGRPWNHPEIYGAALTNVTLDQVHAAARELIHPDRLTWVIAGDLDTIEEQVRALNIGKVEVIVP